ncbi:MAG: SPOR domain-containing protein [Candidatus Cloacimonadales bacterium]
MKRIHALIILISLIVTVVILIAYVVGNIRYKLENSLPPEVSSVLSEDNIPNNVGQTLFALQLFASNNFKKINRLQGKLESQGQKTKITKLKRDGEIVYRLRAEDLLPEDEAIALGEQLKQRFSEIDGYWLEEQAIYIQPQRRETEFDQFADELAAAETTEAAPQEVAASQPQSQTAEKPKARESSVDLESKKFEIQLLASSDFDAINKHQEYLDKQGFPAKILKIVIDGKTIYRLRLQERLNLAQATALGKRLISETYFQDFWLQDLQGNEVYPASKPQIRPTFSGDYEIQLLANPSREFVEDKLAELHKTRFRGKIVSAVVKGTRYYRLRTLDSYDFEQAQKVAEELKDEVDFVLECWVVKADREADESNDNAEVETQQAKADSPAIAEVQNDNMITSLDPRYAPRRILYTIAVPKNNIEIMTGPGRHYDLDNLGRLMKGVEIYVVEERNDWLRFRLIKNKFDWTGWVHKDDVR